ncbi:MAG: transcription termination/antitermination factor NusG [Rothia mucilaginosa]|uniref:transcription termination/antitermination protein NusG n=1 Tax=Rothia mucilaginosa TaxID=43675 RepID=UPI001D574500|nr:transcription termination/antitermination protein NusG [Rothia mucilaginosa]MBS6433357.1 transcription termination/antitermination factor NusG [Rothia mucilaginosa]
MSEQELVSEIEEVEVAAAEAAEEVEAAEQLAEEATEVVEAAEEVDALEEFKSKLRRQVGDWYVVHTYSGYENKVKSCIETRIQFLEAEVEIFEVQVPMESVVEFKNTVKKTIRRVRVPGYVLVRMELTDHSWGVVRHTPGVTGFVGQDAYNPVPLRMEEVFEMLLPVFEEQQQSQGLPVSKPVVESDYTVGENVRVKSGAFEGMDATVSEIKAEAQQIVVMISVFGRDTPVTLSFTEIEKI